MIRDLAELAGEAVSALAPAAASLLLAVLLAVAERVSR